jgi:hypothetical protein
MTSTTCTKCDGAGRIGGFEHVMHGLCFACGGSGRVSVDGRQARKSARIARNQERNATLRATDPALSARWDAESRLGSRLFDEAKRALHEAPTTQAGIEAMRQVLRP